MNDKYVFIKKEFIRSDHFRYTSTSMQTKYLHFIENEIPVIHEVTLSNIEWSSLKVSSNERLTMRNNFIEDAPLEKVIAARLKGLI